LNKKYLNQFFTSFFAVFFGNSVTLMPTLANNASDPAQKSGGKIRPKLRFSCVFPAENLARFCHAVLDFSEHQGLPPD
tara:strand:- start:203 stop:436 length:234 start_codon:yes stop_codon:yes gene_type:complete